MECPSRAVPVFPLPSCVVLPGGVQALHVFEPRYRRMIADELAQPACARWIAMALLRRGYEQDYYTHHAQIYPTLCLANLIKHHALPDGRCNILIQGCRRVSLRKEQYHCSYRLGLLEPESTVNDLLPDEETALRSKLASRLQQLPEKLLKIACEITANEQDLERAVDMITFYVLGSEATPAKQMILAEPRVDFRTKMLITLLERQFLRKNASCSVQQWPPVLDSN